MHSNDAAFRRSHAEPLFCRGERVARPLSRVAANFRALASMRSSWLGALAGVLLGCSNGGGAPSESTAAATASSSWRDDPTVPLCPNTGVTILPDTFPAVAYTTWAPNVDDNASFGAPFVRAILAHATAKPYGPHIYVEGPAFDDLTTRLGGVDMSRVVSVGAPVTREQFQQWQQDYFVSLFAPATGNPTLMLVGDAESSDESDTFDELTGFVTKMTAAFPVTLADATLPASGTEDLEATDRRLQGEKGGNMQALPGGYCLHGSNQDWSGVAEAYCGNHENEVAIDTDWLAVSHADEVVSTIPLPSTEGVAPECAFAIAFASPALGVRVLDEQNWSDGALTSLPHLDKEPLAALRETSLGAQAKLDAIEATVKAHIAARLPQCNVSYIELPVIYGHDYDGGFTTRLVARTANVVNSMNAEGVVITEDPVVPVLRDAATRAYHEAGVQAVEFVPRKFSAQNGGVHCATHAIRVCRPRA